MIVYARSAAVLMLLATTTSLFGESPPPDQVVTVMGEKADCDVSRKTGDSDLATHTLRVGSGGDDLRGFAPLFFFTLPKLPSRDALVGAELELHYMGVASVGGSGSSPPAFDADLYGLGTRPTLTGSVEDYPGGSASALLLVHPLLTPNSPLGRTRVSDARFREYVASLYNPDGTPTAPYAVFRVSTDAKFPPANRRYQGYELASADKPNGAVTYTPQLTLTYRPEPVAAAPSGEDLRPAFGILVALLVGSIVANVVLLVLFLLTLRKLRPPVRP